MTGKLRLNATWNLEPLPASEQPGVAYLLVDVTEEGSPTGDQGAGAPTPQAQSPIINLSLVLDTSGSMAGAKLQNLKGAVRWLVEHLSAQDTIAITHFDDEVHPLAPSARITDKEALLKQVDAIREAGGTAMSKGLLVGLDEALKGRSAGSVSRILVLTDGQTWGDAERCKELAAQAGAAGIPITALGVGAEEDWSIELVDGMAAASGGLSGYIARPEEISAAFEDTLRAMRQTTAHNLRLTLNPARGVGIRAAYRVAPIISKLWPAPDAYESSEAPQPPDALASAQEAAALTLPLGDMQAESGQAILFEILLPARKPGQYRLAHLLLKHEAAGGQAENDTALDLMATFAAGAMRGPGNPRVMNSVEKATTFKLQTRALQASMAGDVVAATRNLRAAATRLLNMGELELAEAAEKEAQLLESEGKTSAAGTKKLAFETRKLGTDESKVQSPKSKA